ncbi:hypothetical protein HHI36_023940 [Cryptolaemus montrouzieri]|uniref:Uncharacterized protein n=1 Tax=Cryptolaemus montrouzieri TaxID=559131 RepID=A0ABD2N0Y1_9CUCU
MLLKNCSAINKNLLIEKHGVQEKKDLKDFCVLLAQNLANAIKKTAIENVREMKRQKIVTLQTKEDILTLKKYTRNRAGIFLERFKIKKTLLNDKVHASFILTDLMIFNRRRPGETERACDYFRKYSTECQAEPPELLRATLLRKQVPTKAADLELNDTAINYLIAGETAASERPIFNENEEKRKKNEISAQIRLSSEETDMEEAQKLNSTSSRNKIEEEPEKNARTISSDSGWIPSREESEVEEEPEKNARTISRDSGWIPSREESEVEGNVHSSSKNTLIIVNGQHGKLQQVPVYKTKYQPTPMSTSTIVRQQHPHQRTFEFEELYNVETQNDDFNEHLEELLDENLYDENLYDENDETDENFRSTASEPQQK